MKNAHRLLVAALWALALISVCVVLLLASKAQSDIVCPGSGFHWTPKTMGEVYERFLTFRSAGKDQPEDRDIIGAAYDLLSCYHK
jgi:hypothetical protein